MKETILIAVSKWAVNNLNVVESLKNVGTDILEKVLWTPLKKKIINFFDNGVEAEAFIKEISEKPVQAERKPYRDVEDVFEEMKGAIVSRELFDTIAQFFVENQALLKTINLSAMSENQGNITLNQYAEKIYNAKVMTIGSTD